MDEPPVRAVWIHRVEAPALVLGSSQAPELADPGALAEQGVELAVRRSGGGAVLLEPGQHLWADVLVPAGDGLWDPDVVRAAAWLGDVWQQALHGLGVPAEVHRGRLEAGPWGALLCFAGLGPGEVTVQGQKLVGLSQRRTRLGARFQCVAIPRWEPGPTAGLLALTPSQRQQVRRDLPAGPPGPMVDLAALEAAFLRALPA